MSCPRLGDGGCVSVLLALSHPLSLTHSDEVGCHVVSYMTERPVWPKGQPLGNSPWETEALNPTTCAKPIPPLVELWAECTSKPYALRKTLSQRTQLSCVQILDPQQLWDDKCVPFSASQFCDKFWSDRVGKRTWPPTHSNGAESLGEGAVSC